MDDQVNHDYQPLGWTDTSNPSGRGFSIMTEVGLKNYDLDEKDQFDAEVARIEALIKKSKE